MWKSVGPFLVGPKELAGSCVLCWFAHVQIHTSVAFPYCWVEGWAKCFLTHKDQFMNFDFVLKLGSNSDASQELDNSGSAQSARAVANKVPDRKLSLDFSVINTMSSMTCTYSTLAVACT